MNSPAQTNPNGNKNGEKKEEKKTHLFLAGNVFHLSLG
jgi:hypothetical protein